MRYRVPAIALFGLMLVAGPASAAQSCSERQQTCFAYCTKSSATEAGCRRVCARLLNTCMATGCWESKITARQCGLVHR